MTEDPDECLEAFFENFEPPCEVESASTSPAVQQRERLKITFNKNIANKGPLGVTKRLKSLFGDDDDVDLELPTPTEFTCKSEKIIKMTVKTSPDIQPGSQKNETKKMRSAALKKDAEKKKTQKYEVEKSKPHKKDVEKSIKGGAQITNPRAISNSSRTNCRESSSPNLKRNEKKNTSNEKRSVEDEKKQVVETNLRKHTGRDSSKQKHRIEKSRGSPPRKPGNIKPPDTSGSRKRKAMYPAEEPTRIKKHASTASVMSKGHQPSKTLHTKMKPIPSVSKVNYYCLNPLEKLF